MNKKIVYIGMSADILHHGHLNIINEGKKLGNVVVGLLTDEAISSYKRLPLITFKNNILDYTNIETEYIFSNNLLITHQVIIPKSEINRLLVKFDRTNKKINPDVVIIDKNDLSSNVKFNNLKYCLIFNNNQFQLFTRKNLTKECN